MAGLDLALCLTMGCAAVFVSPPPVPSWQLKFGTGRGEVCLKVSAEKQIFASQPASNQVRELSRGRAPSSHLSLGRGTVSSPQQLSPRR